MVTEPVEQRGGQLLVAEGLDSLGECKTRGDDRGAAFIAVGEQIEEQFAASSVEGREAQLIHDQQRDAQATLLQTRERVFLEAVSIEQLFRRPAHPLAGPAHTVLARVEADSQNLSTFEFTAQARATNLGNA